MKLLLLLLPILCLAQAPKKPNKIRFYFEVEVVEKSIFLKDTMYKCKNQTLVRITKDSVYVYKKHQYFKFKKQ
jgi:cbb3-type cytochrome oxidase cytochrome c subunit